MSPGPMRWQIRKRENTLPPSAPPPPTDEEQEADMAVSFSRDSAGKEQRLREWREQQDRERQEQTHFDREHRRNDWTAHKHGLQVAGQVSSIERAADVGARGMEILHAATATGASVVIIPSLRRLGVGVAQVLLRRQLEAAGLTIVSENERENSVLACEPSPRRERDLWDFAGDNELEWRTNKKRLADAHFDYWATPDGQAVLRFIDERPHLSLRQLAAALEFRGLKTPTGRTDAWHPKTVSRARQRAKAARSTTAPPQGLRL